MTPEERLQERHRFLLCFPCVALLDLRSFPREIVSSLTAHFSCFERGVKHRQTELQEAEVCKHIGHPVPDLWRMYVVSSQKKAARALPEPPFLTHPDCNQANYP